MWHWLTASVEDSPHAAPVAPRNSSQLHSVPAESLGSSPRGSHEMYDLCAQSQFRHPLLHLPITCFICSICRVICFNPVVLAGSKIKAPSLEHLASCCLQQLSGSSSLLLDGATLPPRLSMQYLYHLLCATILLCVHLASGPVPCRTCRARKALSSRLLYTVVASSFGES